MNWNVSLFDAINGMAGQSHALDLFMIFCSRYLPYFFALLIVFIFFIGVKQRNLACRQMAVSTVAFTCINLAISFLIGLFYYSPRPFVYNDVHLLYPHAVDSSFPSDHATASMSIALGFGAFNKALGAILVILSLLIGVSRVYVGHHYPSDVLGAYFIVIGTDILYNQFLRRQVMQLYAQVEAKIFGR